MHYNNLNNDNIQYLLMYHLNLQKNISDELILLSNFDVYSDITIF